MKVQVSERALVGRINRVLKGEGKRLRIAHPGSRLEANLARYYVLDGYTNNVVDYFNDLAAFARKCECIAAHEEYA